MYRQIELKIVNIVNMTPHELTFVNGEKSTTIPSSGIVRAKQNAQEHLFTIESEEGLCVNVAVMSPIEFGEPENVPEEVKGSIYVVSAIAAQAIKKHLPHRKDFFIVCKTVRNEAGQIIGCESITTL